MDTRRQDSDIISHQVRGQQGGGTSLREKEKEKERDLDL